jgi:hypothetical protein
MAGKDLGRNYHRTLSILYWQARHDRMIVGHCLYHTGGPEMAGKDLGLNYKRTLSVPYRWAGDGR